MKLIATDNFNRDEVSDRLIEENLSEKDAKKKAAAENAKGDEYSMWYYRAVPDDYRLKIWEP